LRLALTKNPSVFNVPASAQHHTKSLVLSAASGFAIGAAAGQRLANVYPPVEKCYPWV
jgi:hypothetical protein